MKTLLVTLEEEYAKFRESGFSSIRSEFKGFSCTLGRHISVTTSAGKSFHGRAVDVDRNGALVVKLDNDKEMTFLSGDVTLVR